MPCSAFTLRDTGKLATVPNGISVSVQYEHLYTILYKPFVSGLVSVSVNAPLERPTKKSFLMFGLLLGPSYED